MGSWQQSEVRRCVPRALSTNWHRNAIEPSFGALGYTCTSSFPHNWSHADLTCSDFNILIHQVKRVKICLGFPPKPEVLKLRSAHGCVHCDVDGDWLHPHFNKFHNYGSNHWRAYGSTYRFLADDIFHCRRRSTNISSGVTSIELAYIRPNGTVRHNRIMQRPIFLCFTKYSL